MGDDHSGLIPKPKAGAAPNEIAVADFFDCKTKTLTIGPNAPGWVTFSMVFNGPSFVQDESGKVAIKIKLPKSDAELPTSVKGGKLHVDTRAAHGAEASFPQLSGQKVKDKAQEIDRYVEGLNTILNEKGHQFGGVTVKDGKLTLTKVALPVPGKAEGKPDDKHGSGGIKGGPFPHVPTWEKVGAGFLLGAAVLFGVGFMNAGDGTETRPEKVCPEAGGPGESMGAGIDCPETGSDVDKSVPAQGLAQLIRTVSITPEGADPASGAVEPSNEPNKIFLELPLFMIGERDTVELLDKRNATLDTFTFTVPSKQGLAPAVTTERGGTVMCLIDHENPVPPGRSGADCQYTEPVADAATPPTPDDSEPVVPESREFEEDTEGKPWSLLAIPGAVLGLAGGLALEEERRRRDEPDLGGFDPTTGTYPDWETTYPDWQDTGPAEDVPPPEPPPTLDVM
ncbi:MAG: hypothetical protein ACT4PI_12625 [Actinomycetota bacterium]